MANLYDEWNNWESGDCVGYPSDRPNAILEQADVIRRVSVAFRRVVIDWPEGNRWSEARFAKAIKVYQGFLLEAEQALIGRSVLVSIADEGGDSAAWLRFYMTPDTGLLELNYEPIGAEDRCRVVAKKLAAVLGYEFSRSDAR